MEKIKRIGRRVLFPLAIAASLYASPVEAIKPQINPGYNSLENGLVTERTQDGGYLVRNRLLSNVSLKINNAEVSYSGLNQANDWNSKSYFGRNKLTIGKKNFPLRILADVKSNKKGVFDKKFGVRNTSLISKLGGYGYSDLSFDEETANSAVLYGKQIGKGYSLQIFQDTTIGAEQKPSYYTEVQLNKQVTDKLNLFGRAEIRNFNEDLTTCLVGANINLRGD